MKTLDPAPERWRGTGGALEGSPKEDRMNALFKFQNIFVQIPQIYICPDCLGREKGEGGLAVAWVGWGESGGRTERRVPPALGGSGRTENSHGEPAAFSLVSRHSQIVTLIENDLLRFSLNNR